MRKKAQHAYTWKHYYELLDLFREYLEHRLHHHNPYTTLKRYLVSRNKRFYCDLYDDCRRGLTEFPRYGDLKTFAFTTRLIEEGCRARLQALN